MTSGVPAEKPTSAFNSTTSLAPLQTSSAMGPGQKLQQQPQHVRRSTTTKALLISSDNFTAVTKSTANFSMTTRGITLNQLTAKTPIIKLTKIEDFEQKSITEESKLTASASTKKETAAGASVAETYKQRLAQWRRTMSKGMIFADQLEIRNPQMVTELA